MGKRERKDGDIESERTKEEGEGKQSNRMRNGERILPSHLLNSGFLLS